MTVAGRVRVVAVTGASGLLGRHLCDHLRREGYAVRALVRHPEAYPFCEPGVERFACDLPLHLDERALVGADVLIHCAYMTRFTNIRKGRQVNETGTAQVVAAARRHRVRRVVFISSLSAHAEARSYYGRSKFALEQTLNPEEDLVLRPGLVLARDGGLFARLVATVQQSPVIPLLGGHQMVHTIHIDDLCACVAAALQRNLTGLLHLCEPVGLHFVELLKRIARLLGQQRLFLPVPARPVLLSLWLTEALGFSPPLSSENVLGLLSLRSVDPSGDLKRLGIQVRDAHESLVSLFFRNQK